MKNTILSENDALLLEKALLQYGRILTVDDLMNVFQGHYSRFSAHNRINLLTSLGWLRRIKRGLYLIIDNIPARSQIDVSLASIANALMLDSYVSLSHALNYYQLFDQYSPTVVSITFTVNKKYLFDNYIFRYLKVKKSMYFGFTEKIIDGKKVRMAEAEKALIDYLYLDRSFECASLVFEKLKEYSQELDLKKLQKYALHAGLTVSRKIGFMLDQLGLDSTSLHEITCKNRSISKLTAKSKSFNAKWRLYYDNRIIG